MLFYYRSRPTTPEAERQNTRAAARMHQIENMTDPDHRRSQARLHRQPVLPQGIQQPLFGPDLAAQIPEVHIPENIDAPRQFIMPVIPPVPVVPARRGRPRRISGPRNVLSGPQANADLHNVHRGQIAHRDQVDNYREQVEIHRQGLQALQALQAEQQERQRQALILQQLQEAEQQARQRQALMLQRCRSGD
jgi:hypothetical protein